MIQTGLYELFENEHQNWSKKCIKMRIRPISFWQILQYRSKCYCVLGIFFYPKLFTSDWHIILLYDGWHSAQFLIISNKLSGWEMMNKTVWKRIVNIEHNLCVQHTNILLVSSFGRVLLCIASFAWVMVLLFEMCQVFLSFSFSLCTTKFLYIME